MSQPTFEKYNGKARIDTEDTEKAFVYKDDKSLKKSRLLFSLMTIAPLVKLGTHLTPFLIKSGLPLKKLIKKTLFEQFVGGESLEETIPVCKLLGKFKVDVILDYGIEGGEYDDPTCDLATEEFIKVIRFASTQNNIPFISIKITGLTTFSLLEKINVLINPNHNINIFGNSTDITKSLSQDDKIACEKLFNRLDNICKNASESGIGILIDAEESWIQDTIDHVTHTMMKKYNTEKAIVYNTIQLYRHDRLQLLRDAIENAEKENYKLAVKLVRGAYLEKETKRAKELGYMNPLQKNKEATDQDYDAAVLLCLKKFNSISTIIASHNEKSNLLAATYIDENKIPSNHHNIHFSQLYGMSDNLTFNLADAGCNVSKYLPFGKVEDVIPYLMRRAQENSSIAGQTGRELELIKKECIRRGI
ncbi:MAG: proline dehydrogenase family protein [bacterium]